MQMVHFWIRHEKISIFYLGMCIPIFNCFRVIKFFLKIFSSARVHKSYRIFKTVRRRLKFLGYLFSIKIALSDYIEKLNIL